MARYGLNLHLGVEIERVALDPPPRQGYAERSFDQDLRSELTEREPGVVWIAKRERWDELQARIAALGYRTQAVGPDTTDASSSWSDRRMDERHGGRVLAVGQAMRIDPERCVRTSRSASTQAEQVRRMHAPTQEVTGWRSWYAAAVPA